MPTCLAPNKNRPLHAAEGPEMFPSDFNSQSATKASVEQRGSITREQMIARGAYGFLSRAYEWMIPVDTVVTLLPDPVCADWGAYRHGDEAQPIEVKYSAEEETFLLFAGNLRLKEAVDRGDRHIRAFVEVEADQLDAALRLQSSRPIAAQ
jgi:hypothetical protein